MVGFLAARLLNQSAMGQLQRRTTSSSPAQVKSVQKLCPLLLSALQSATNIPTALLGNGTVSLANGALQSVMRPREVQLKAGFLDVRLLQLEEKGERQVWSILLYYKL